MIVAFPHVETFQYFFDDMLLLDKSNDFHFALTFGAYERIYFVDFLNQARPVSPECLICEPSFDWYSTWPYYRW